MSDEIREHRSRGAAPSGADPRSAGGVSRAARAIRDGDEGALRAALHGHPDLVRHPEAGHLLIQAAGRNAPALVAALLEAGIRADVVGESGETPLMEAAGAGDVRVVRMLLERGSDPDALPEHVNRKVNPDAYGRGALYLALLEGHRQVVDLLTPVTRPDLRALAEEQVLRERQRRESESPPPSPADAALFRAVVRGDREQVLVALEAGADANALLPETASTPTPGGRTPLWFAATSGNLPVVGLLLEYGADIDAPGDLQGNTPLAAATRMSRVSVVAALVAAGADPGIRNADGLTAWDWGRKPLCREGGDALRRAWREVHGTEPAE